jgi:putative ABC transport system ATP-binding protein
MTLQIEREPVVSAVALTKTYPRGREEVRALQEVSFAIASGEFVAIIGPSGSGKTTLLSLIGCMDVPSAGTLSIGGHAVQGLSERERTKLRRDQIGFVFQQFGLLPTLTVAENVLLPSLFARRRQDQALNGLLAKVGLTERRDHLPHQLSGGEMQRVAIARALVNEPKILLADEPTGNLDSENARTVLNLFAELNATGLTVIMVTHNPEFARFAHRQILLKDGRIV